MNINGFARGYMAKNQKPQEFFNHVVSCIESQLKEWSKDYHVYIVKLAHYNLIVKNGPRNYNVELSEEEIESLQKRGGYALDREIWRQLEKQRLPIEKKSGDYFSLIGKYNFL